MHRVHADAVKGLSRRLHDGAIPALRKPFNEQAVIAQLGKAITSRLQSVTTALHPSSIGAIHGENGCRQMPQFANE